MRWTFKDHLYALMERDTRTHLLWCDVGIGLFQKHLADFPGRCLNCGTAEQATVSMAAGMAIAGLRPILYSITPFLLERAFEQIKIDVDQMNLPVGIIGHSDHHSGPTHQELNARAMIGLCKNIRGYFPETKDEMIDAMGVVDLDKPWFLALKTLT